MTHSKNSPHRTDKQAAFLRRLVLSAEFSEAEAEDTNLWLEGPKATVSATSEAIDHALDRIGRRDDNKKASQRRRDNYRQAKPYAHQNRQERHLTDGLRNSAQAAIDREREAEEAEQTASDWGRPPRDR